MIDRDMGMDLGPVCLYTIVYVPVCFRLSNVMTTTYTATLVTEGSLIMLDSCRYENHRSVG